MNKLALVAAGLAFFSTAAFANSKPSDEEATKIKATLTEWGCEGGTLEKETEATSVFEVGRRQVQRRPVRPQDRQRPDEACSPRYDTDRHSSYLTNGPKPVSL